MIDTHTHLNFKAFENDWKEIVDRAVAAGVEKMIVVGTDVETSKRSVEMAQEHEALFASVGIHPHHAKAWLTDDSGLDQALRSTQELASDPKVVAVGEIGLDKHEYKNTKYGPRDNSLDQQDFAVQKKLFIAQLTIAHTVNKPVIIHSRDLRDDALDTMKQLFGEEIPVKGVFHCFEGSKKYLKRVLDAGFMISFTGNITFIPDRAEVSALVPLDMLLLETDCPYMTPHPFRTQRNEPKLVMEVAKKHAEVRSLAVEEIVRQTTENARTLFGV